MAEMTVSQRAALLRLYESLNSLVKAGRVWVTYHRETADAMLDVLKQVLSHHGLEFRPIEDEKQ